MSIERAGGFPGRRILVTGGCGFIGSHITRRIASCDRPVVVLDDLSTGIRDAVAGVQGVTFIRGSVLDASVVNAAVRGCDLVIHLAGVVGKMRVFRDPERAYRTSVDGTRNVLAAASHARVVVFSSSAVYGIDGAAVAREDADIDDVVAASYDGGRRGYGLGKLHMERLAHEASINGQPTLIVRPFNVVGPGQTGRYGMVIPRFVHRALRNASLQVFGDGLQTRSFGHVRTFVDVLWRLMENAAAWQPKSNVFNIGNPRATPVLDLAHEVLRVTGSHSPIQFVPYQHVFVGQRDVLARSPDVTRLEQLIRHTEWPAITRVIRDVYEAHVAARRIATAESGRA